MAIVNEAAAPAVRHHPSRSGFGLRAEVHDEIKNDFDSVLVQLIKAAGGTHQVGRLTFRLAQEFGFCYGVDHALDLAYETHVRFPDRRVYLTGEIIHNPTVNEQLAKMGYSFLRPGDDVTADDIVLIPAFGAPTHELERLKNVGCLLVDTTCGSVVHVWKRVEKYAREGFTAIIHGKYDHEETEATRSRTTLYEGGKFLVVRDRAQAQDVCDYIEGRGDRERFLAKYAAVATPGFDPDRDLERVGLANQTTMLSSESLEIADMVRRAMERRYGPDELKARFRSFDTICSATQERQDAILQLIEEPLDLVIVVGGYNSSNTEHLCEIASERLPTYHINAPECLVSATEIRHKPAFSKEEATTQNWLPAGNITIGITAGASTPNKVVGDCIERIAALAGAA
ncbi:4-hydroxy-3-methylbut-2-enyl diphosphate reductase [Chloracidobacterium validum]|uniref:4-hydroxy-3-methylbut-2-enyl diphosphate reductase n=1 Tax=Chloracidobacterium validum TaxID=2821543 RepID=A0ABX8BBR4_9BACT|nr:4-hydroxy-3-methylbut-2-enyl diphosphate reductase [Chloracidobacterium validum]QUW04377.1 4-hydroxy-3-methylbut-2-enyl diphosphate reductase [Chloracidobacterium validum]